ncbi:MAG: hypothetical protein ABF479_01240 [Gluconacetobacter sp.]
MRALPRVALAVLVASALLHPQAAHAMTIEQYVSNIVTHFGMAFKYLIAFGCFCAGVAFIFWGVYHWRLNQTNRNAQHGPVAIGTSIFIGAILLSLTAFITMFTSSVSDQGVQFNGTPQQFNLDP